MESTVIQYEGPIYCDPAFPISFHEDNMTPTRRFIYTHWHSGVEILYFHEGNGHLLYRSKSIPFSKGEILVIGSDMLHTLSADSPSCSYHCLIVEPRFLTGNAVPQDKVYPTFVTASKDAAAIMNRIIAEFRRADMLYKPAVLGCILQLFAVLQRCCTNEAEQEPQSQVTENVGRQHTSIQMALNYIRENLSGSIVLEELCSHVGMSKYYFCRLFKSYTGMPPLQYINMLRCDRARHLITKGQMNITEAAHAVGIDNTSYFTKIYKKYIGVLPSDDATRKDKRDRKGSVIGVLKTLRE